MLEKTRFTEMLIAENGLDRGGFDHWVFCPGMRFNSPKKWWGDHGRRAYPHEGVDFCLYRDRAGQVCRLDENTRLPAMHDGTVKAVFTDYLGRALIIEHESPLVAGGRFLSIYAHTRPAAGMRVGAVVRKGDVIAAIAGTAGSKSGIIPHLHFSLGIPAPSFSYAPFTWDTIQTPEMITLRDPFQIMDRPGRVLDAGDICCREL
ncbi:MAG: M23 family metallopeptidase [Desulfobacterales bacterium]